MTRFFLLMAGVLAVNASTAGEISQCPVDTIPIQITNEIRSRPETILSAVDMSDDSKTHFHAFMTAVTKHVAERLSKNKLCIDNAESKKHSLLQFVNWPLTSGYEPLAPVPPLDARPSHGCRITSPWIDFAVERRPVPWIRGVVRWNPRQLLADQAVLAGARNVPTGVAMPLTQKEIRFALTEYEGSELFGKPAAKPIEARIPPDLLWLFRRSSQNTRGPFSGMVGGAMDNATKVSAERYTQLVVALIDRCFASDGADIHYNSILDVAGLISLEQYKIKTLIR